jgi:hypothetical protein
MRARPREINIFNMSLLDILCGALGAFCFMMLAALPYYPTGDDPKRNDQDILVILQEIETLRQQGADPKIAEAQQKLLERLKAELQQLQGERNQLANENARLISDNEAAAKGLAIMHDKLDAAEAEADRLEQENVEQKQVLAAKKPFVVMAASSSQPVDLYLERSRFTVMGNKFESFNPAEILHGSPIPEDVSGWAFDNGVTFWVNANSKPGDAYRIYVKFLKIYTSPPSGDTTVKLNFFGAIADKNASASVALNTARPWTFVGMVNVEKEGALSFKEATQAERDDDWRTRTKTEPPPAPTPSAKRAQVSASPSPAGTAPGTSPPSRAEADEKVREYMRRRGAVPPSPSANGSATPGSSSVAPAAAPMSGSEAAARALRERAAGASASPAASPVPSASP